LVVTVWVVKKIVCLLLKCKRTGYKNVLDQLRNKSRRVAQVNWKGIKNAFHQSSTGEDNSKEEGPEEERMIADDQEIPDLRSLYPKLAILLNENKVSTISGNYYIPLLLGGRRYNGLLDSGSSLSLIAAHVFKKMGKAMKPILMRATSVTGHQLNLIGQADIDVSVGGRRLKHRFGIVDGKATEEVLLGSDFLTQIGPVTMDLTKGNLTIFDKDDKVTIKLKNSNA
jgi:hypothetical protein